MKVRITFRYNNRTVEAYALMMGTMYKVFGSIYNGMRIDQKMVLKVETI